MGAATSAITGQDPGKGALIGGLTGAIGGGLGGVLGGIGDTAEAAAPMQAAGVTTEATTAPADLAASSSGFTGTGSIGGDLASMGYTPASTAAGDIGAGSGFNYSLAGANAPIAGQAAGAGNPFTTGAPSVGQAAASDIGAGSGFNYNLAGANTPTGVAGAAPTTPGLPPAPSWATQQVTPTKFLDDPVGWVKNNQGTAAMGALGLGTTAYGMMHPTNYGIPSSSTVNQGPITPYKYDPSKYQPNYPVPNVYVPHYAEGGIAQLADGGMAGTPPNMLDGPADLDFMGGGAFPMSQQSHSYYAAPTQMPTSAQQAMASYEPNTNPLTGEPVAHMAQGGIAQLAVGGKLLKGQGDGMSDSIKANIAGKQEARLADSEFVVPADVVSHLGNGSTDAGAKHLYAMMNRVRKARTGKKKQAPAIEANKYLPA